MEAFIIVAFGTGIAGALIGWLCRGRLQRALLLSIAGSVALLGMLWWYGGEPKSWDLRYLPTFPVYWIFPYILFFLLPSAASACVVTLLYPFLVTRFTH